MDVSFRTEPLKMNGYRVAKLSAQSSFSQSLSSPAWQHCFGEFHDAKHFMAAIQAVVIVGSNWRNTMMNCVSCECCCPPLPQHDFSFSVCAQCPTHASCRAHSIEQRVGNTLAKGPMSVSSAVQYVCGSKHTSHLSNPEAPDDRSLLASHTTRLVVKYPY